MFSVAQMLLPISAESACGDDVSFSSEVDAIARARIDLGAARQHRLDQRRVMAELRLWLRAMRAPIRASFSAMICASTASAIG